MTYAVRREAQRGVSQLYGFGKRSASQYAKTSPPAKFTGVSAAIQARELKAQAEKVGQIEQEYTQKGWIGPAPPVKPEDIGEVVDVVKDHIPRPSPVKERIFLGSPEFLAQQRRVEAMSKNYAKYTKEGVYTSPSVTAFEKKWAPYIKTGQFVGSEDEYGRYTTAREKAYAKQTSEISLYGAQTAKLQQMETVRQERYQTLQDVYTKYGKAKTEYEGLRAASLIGKYERFEEKTGTFIAARTPTWQQVQEGGIVTRVMAKERAWEAEHIPGAKRFDTAMEQYKKGVYEGMREQPLKTAVTTAAFFALPVALKGVGMGLKAARITPTIAKIPGVGPGIIKYTPKAIGTGLGAAYGASVGYRVYKTPAEQRAYEFGKITGTEILPMGLGTAAGLKALQFRLPPVQKPRMPKFEGPTYKYEGMPKIKERPGWEVPDLVPRRGTGGRDILMGKKPYVPKVEPYKYKDTTTFEGFEKPARGRIEIAEGKSRLEIIKEISETTDIARIKALEAKLVVSKPVSRRGQPVEDWGKIWKQREVETAKRIKAGELQVQEMAGGELGLLQITKTVKAPKIKTIAAARTKQAQYQEQIQKQIQKQRAFVVPIYMQKPVQIPKEISKQSQIYVQPYKFEAMQVAAQKSFAAMKEEAAYRMAYVGIPAYKVPGVQVFKVPGVQVFKVPGVQVPKMVEIAPLFLYKPPKEKKKKAKKRKYKQEPSAWIVKNPIPTMQQMMTTDMNKIMADMKKAQTGSKPKKTKTKSRKKKK